MNEKHTRFVPTEVRYDREKVEETRTTEFVISTSARDTYHTRLNQRAWDLDRYHRNGIVGYQHNVWGAGLCNEPNPDFVLGPGRAWVEEAPRSARAPDEIDDARLIGSWTAEPREINELSEKIFRKVMFGTLRATSVGFFADSGRWGEGEEAQGERNETFYFDRQELFEWSVVNMGANPLTVKRGIESDTRAAIDFIKQRVPELSTRDVLRMTVKDILDALDGKPERAAFTSTTEREQRRPLTSFIEESVDTTSAFREAAAKRLS